MIYLILESKPKQLFVSEMEFYITQTVCLRFKSFAFPLFSGMLFAFSFGSKLVKVKTFLDSFHSSFQEVTV